MKTQLFKNPRRNSCALGGLTWFAAPVLGLILAACNSSAPLVTKSPQPPQEIKAPEVPASLLVPPGNGVSLHVYAIGVQIYDWTVNATNSSQAVWVMKAPEAALFNGDGKLVGYHYGGPTWENKSGLSYVQAVVMQRGTSDPNAVPWLLLRAKNAASHGMFARTTYIQRVNTTGGLPPTTVGDHIGKQARVPYMAEYYFYREQSQNSHGRSSAAINLINNERFAAPVGDASAARLGCAYPTELLVAAGGTTLSKEERDYALETFFRWQGVKVKPLSDGLAKVVLIPKHE